MHGITMVWLFFSFYAATACVLMNARGDALYCATESKVYVFESLNAVTNFNTKSSLLWCPFDCWFPTAVCQIGHRSKQPQHNDREEHL